MGLTTASRWRLTPCESRRDLKDAGSPPSVRFARPMGSISIRARENGRACSSLQSDRCSRTVTMNTVVSGRGLWVVALAAWMVTMAGCATGNKIEGKIGLMDPARVLNDSNAGKKAKDSLAAFSKNRQALIEMEEKELRRMEEDFIKQASVLSPAAKTEREQVCRRRMAEYQQKAGELNREVQEKQKDVLEAFRDKVDALVAKSAKKNELQILINKGKGGTAIYGDEALDTTSQVIEQFNKEYP